MAQNGRMPSVAIDRAGLVGADGATHAGSFDLAYLGCLPGMVIMAPSDEAELMHMVATSAVHDGGPSAVRYPRGEGTGVALPSRGEVLPIGRGRILREGGYAARGGCQHGAQGVGGGDDLCDGGQRDGVAVPGRWLEPGHGVEGAVVCGFSVDPGRGTAWVW